MMFVASLLVFAHSLLCLPFLLLAMFVHERGGRGEANCHSSGGLIMLGQYIPIGGNVELFKPTPSSTTITSSWHCVGLWVQPCVVRTFQVLYIFTNNKYSCSSIILINSLVIVNNWKTDWSSKISDFLNVAIVMFSITCTSVCKTNFYDRQCDCYQAFYYTLLDLLQQENNNYGTTSTCWVIVHTFAKTCISSDEGYEKYEQSFFFCLYFFPHHLRSQR